MTKQAASHLNQWSDPIPCDQCDSLRCEWARSTFCMRYHSSNDERRAVAASPGTHKEVQLIRPWCSPSLSPGCLHARRHWGTCLCNVDWIRFDWFDSIRFDLIRFALIRFDIIRIASIRFDSMSLDSIWFASLRSDSIRFVLIWFPSNALLLISTQRC